MTKIFSWKAILTQDEHKMPPYPTTMFMSLFQQQLSHKISPFSLDRAEPGPSAHGVWCPRPRLPHASGPQAGRTSTANHRPRPSRNTWRTFKTNARYKTYKTRSIPHPGDQNWWRGAARNPGKVHQGSYDAGQNLILVHLLRIAEPIRFSQHPTRKRNINCGQNQGKVDSLTVLDLTGNVCFKWVSIRS